MNLNPGPQFVLVENNGTQYDMKKILDLKAEEDTLVKKWAPVDCDIPSPEEGPKYLVLYVLNCYGCQTCWRMDENDDIVKHTHIYVARNVGHRIKDLLDEETKELLNVNRGDL